MSYKDRGAIWTVARDTGEEVEYHPTFFTASRGDAVAYGRALHAEDGTGWSASQVPTALRERYLSQTVRTTS